MAWSYVVECGSTRDVAVAGTSWPSYRPGRGMDGAFAFAIVEIELTGPEDHRRH